jgi:hypothetical protein
MSMRNFAVLGAAALLFALGVAQASAANQSGPAGPNIYSQEWNSVAANAANR